jgi:dTDP-4-dehydrorhamnose 3,5-epimerase
LEVKVPFKFITTPIEGVIEVNPAIFGDARGSFRESFKKTEFVANGIPGDFVQDNHSVSLKGVLRGIHFQTAPMAQGKLVKVTRGAVWDVAVDLRPDSASFKQWWGVELSEENGKMFYIPPGFGHGFVTLEDDTHFHYKCTEEYSAEHDVGIRWNDPDLAIKWLIDGLEITVSGKDELLPFLSELTL